MTDWRKDVETVRGLHGDLLPEQRAALARLVAHIETVERSSVEMAERLIACERALEAK